eukprot:10085842-Alexandrium_andersonii.AAC.1
MLLYALPAAGRERLNALESTELELTVPKTALTCIMQLSAGLSLPKSVVCMSRSTSLYVKCHPV